MIIVSKTEHPPAYAQVLTVGPHTLHADIPISEGGAETAPAPHDLFDASLSACKTVTAHWYAKRVGMKLDAVEARVTRDDKEERAGVYKLTVHMTYHGDLSAAERTKLHNAVMHCPIHKLMTTSEVLIETAPLEDWVGSHPL
jgi:putative redox protein